MAVYLLIRPLSRAPHHWPGACKGEIVPPEEITSAQTPGDIYTAHEKHFPLASPFNLAFNQESQSAVPDDPAAPLPRNTRSHRLYSFCFWWLLSLVLIRKDGSLAAFLEPRQPLKLRNFGSWSLPGWVLRVQRVTQFR